MLCPWILLCWILDWPEPKGRVGRCVRTPERSNLGHARVPRAHTNLLVPDRLLGARMPAAVSANTACRSLMCAAPEKIPAVGRAASKGLSLDNRIGRKESGNRRKRNERIWKMDDATSGASILTV